MTTETPYSMNQLKEWIRGRGKRSTGARLAVLDCLQRSNSPLSHNELTEQLEEQGHQRASIYRNLMDLIDVGLVSRFDAGDHTWRYEFHPPDSIAAHPHFLCTDCGTVSCVDEVELRPAKVSSPKSIAKVSEVLIKGQCLDCT